MSCKMLSKLFFRTWNDVHRETRDDQNISHMKGKEENQQQQQTSSEWKRSSWICVVLSLSCSLEMQEALDSKNKMWVKREGENEEEKEEGK